MRLLFVLLMALMRGAAGSVAAQSSAVTWEPERLVNGGPCVFYYRSATPLRTLTGDWQGNRVFFINDPRSGVWMGFAGTDVDVRPGNYQLSLKGTMANGQELNFVQIVPVEKGNYPVSRVTVPRKYVDPDPADMARIMDERRLKDDLFSRVTPERFWAGAFAAPADTTTTSVFGSQRFYNGRRQSIHQGLDFRAAIGTPVRTMNHGRVILARDLYYEGNCVVIDHGQGLLTIYMHLSSFRVQEGDTVRRGQLIAASGDTGRASGPHLHVGVRWQGVYVNPASVLQLRFQ
ncbi:MAG: M23 family metallopeptidase [Blastocatellia bacterium]